MSTPYAAYHQIACSIAKTVGVQIIKHRPTQVDKKGSKDLVSNLDTQAENVIRDYLTLHTPDIPIYAEESGGAKTAPRRWIIDPIDGTTNFVQGIPHFSVSIALQLDGDIVVGVTYDPSKNELFSAQKGGGAWLNDSPIHCAPPCRLADAVLATGFPYDRATRADELLTLVKQFLIESRGIRRMGAATLDMAYLACGRVQGFWEIGLKPWDVAAGLLLIEEAGGVCREWNGSPLDIDQPMVLAANTPELWAVMQSIVQAND